MPLNLLDAPASETGSEPPMSQKRFVMHSSAQTLEFAEGFAKRLERFPACVFLEGPLGAGKTLFTKGLVLGLLGKKAASKVKSPSFVLINEYAGSKGPLVAHVDFYRLEGWQELLDELLDYLSNPCLIVIEWPKLCQSFFVPHVLQAYNISIEIAGPSERLVTVEEL